MLCVITFLFIFNVHQCNNKYDFADQFQANNKSWGYTHAVTTIT